MLCCRLDMLVVMTHHLHYIDTLVKIHRRAQLHLRHNIWHVLLRGLPTSLTLAHSAALLVCARYRGPPLLSKRWMLQSVTGECNSDELPAHPSPSFPPEAVVEAQLAALRWVQPGTQSVQMCTGRCIRPLVILCYSVAINSKLSAEQDCQAAA